MLHHRHRVPTLVGTALLALVFTVSAGADVITRDFNVRDGGLFEIETDRGKIEVQTGSSGQLRVEVLREGDRGEMLEVEFEQSGDRVYVKGEWPRGDDGRSYGRRARVVFTISVPRRFNLDLSTSGGSIRVEDLDGTLRAHTSGGSLGIGHIQGEVDAHTSGGGIKIAGGGSDVRVNTSGGSIRVGPVLGNLNARTSGGSIKAGEVAGSVDASTSGGSVQATMTVQPSQDSELSTSGGSVTLILADGIAVDINATAGGGGIRSDFPIDGKTRAKRSMRGRINGGGPTVRLHTSGGGVRIRSMN